MTAGTLRGPQKASADPAWDDRCSGFPTPFAFFVIGHVTLSWGFAYWLWGTSAFVPLFLTQMAYYAIGDGVNSLLHLWGAKPFQTHDESRNFPVLGFLLLGEGYHNVHHAFPRSLKTGLLPGQFDAIYTFARLLERLSLCRNIVEVRPSEILVRLRDQRHRAYFEREQLVSMDQAAREQQLWKSS